MTKGAEGMIKINKVIQYVKTDYPGKHVEGILVKDRFDSYLYLNINKMNEFYDVIKSGKWIEGELCIKLKTKVTRDGTTKYMNVMHIDNVLNVYGKLEDVPLEDGDSNVS